MVIIIPPTAAFYMWSISSHFILNVRKALEVGSTHGGLNYSERVNVASDVASLQALRLIWLCAALPRDWASNAALPRDWASKAAEPETS